ncbi:protein of unknown function [Candidatus Nitrosocaldus cavascurensis]|uniref:Uncharacterized protein n=1 Tax=Candidatus Nitrosocaldus cavascurensis TaxID=2058097 RepID=A0A2K5ATJ0_9ARCH|nr:protein of unknown function [Candidatus Nitrosocaldus cavascurensis]
MTYFIFQSYYSSIQTRVKDIIDKRLPDDFNPTIVRFKL